MRHIALWLVGLAATVGLTANSPLVRSVSRAPSEQSGGSAIFVISRDMETEEHGDGGSSSSSTDRDTLIERVLAERSDGLELEYDLPLDTTEQDRARQWQFPVRIWRPFSGPPRLIDVATLEKRLKIWLDHAKLTQAACGHWYFTWSAFKIECDPQSTLQTVAAFDLRLAGIRDGTLYQDAMAWAPTALKTIDAGKTFVGEMQVDPDKVRRGQAETDVIVAQISKKPLTLEDALKARAKEKVSGTIAVTIYADAAGEVQRKSTITKLEITGADGKPVHRTVSVLLTRRDLAGVSTGSKGVVYPSRAITSPIVSRQTRRS